MIPEMPSRPPSAMSESDGETHSVGSSDILEEHEFAECGTMYKYRDFSNMPEDKDAPEEPQVARGSLESSIRVQKFPVKLYAILAQKEFHEIITWMPHGRSWKVLKPNLFESMVMPLFFEYSNYHSFNRLVNAWSFRRISSGPDRGSYYHELFLRGKPHLQKYMRRLPKTHKKLAMKKEDEPDFYQMDRENPLPPLKVLTTPVPCSAMAAARVPQSIGLNQANSLVRSSAAFPGLFPDAALSAAAAAAAGFGQSAGVVNRPPLNPFMDFKPQLDSETVQCAQLYNLQRLRKLQQLQLLERQLAGPAMNPFAARSPFAARAPTRRHC